jgi:hypothetical protein
VGKLKDLLARLRSSYGATLESLPRELRVVLLASGALDIVGISWGLPSQWDLDGVGRHIHSGLIDTYTPGAYFTYPPLHLGVLAIATSPVTLVATLFGGGTGLLTELSKPGYTTASSLIVRFVSILMALGILIALAKISEEIAPRGRSRRVGACTAMFITCGVPFTYYAHTSNLDIPSCFWLALAAWSLVKGITRSEPRRLRHALVLAALATTTKDQQYASFVVGLPATVGLWFALDRFARRNASWIAREALIGGALAVALVLAIDGAVTNPSGFQARVAFLRGPGSLEYAMYSSDWVGFRATLRDAFDAGLHYPAALRAPSTALFVVGTAIAIARGRSRDRRTFVASLVPLLFALSFTLCFNVAAHRVEERFTLPQAILMSVYGGQALDWLFDLRVGTRAIHWGARALAGAFAIAGLFNKLQLNANLVGDPRYATEDFLRANARPGDTIEVHGLPHYLPRFGPELRLVRVDPKGAFLRPVVNGRRRRPTDDVGIATVVAPYMDLQKRAPRYVVVNECFAARYLPAAPLPPGRILGEKWAHAARDADATEFFRSLYAGTLGYRVAHDSVYQSKIFRRVTIHGSTGCRVTTFERAVDGA